MSDKGRGFWRKVRAGATSVQAGPYQDNWEGIRPSGEWGCTAPGLSALLLEMVTPPGPTAAHLRTHQALSLDRVE